MFPRAITLLRVKGIPVRVDPTLLLIGLLIVWSFTSQFQQPDRSVLTAVAMASIAAVLFFASILAHELGHALEARHRKMDVHGITLFLFGGVTEMRMHASRPRDEFVIAAVGPWTSFVMAATFGILATAFAEMDGAAAAASAEVAGMLGWLNLALGIFNLVPGAPLDGGRVLRAVLWGVLGDRGRASRWAARAGQGVAVLIMGLGVVSLSVNNADLIGAIWLIFIGSFLWNGARAELGTERVLGMLEGRTADDLGDELLRIDHDRPLSFVELDFEAMETDTALVTDEDRVVAILLPENLATVEPYDREIRTAGDVATPITDLPTVTPATLLTDVLELVQEHPAVAIVDGSDIRTVVTPRSLARQVQRPTPAAAAPPPPPPPPPPPAVTGS